MAATTLALLQMAALALWLAAAPAAARPGQSVVDSSDPRGMTRSEQQLRDAHEGGEVPVQLVYDEDAGVGEEEGVGGVRAARDAVAATEGGVRKSKLLSLEERENDGNAAHGLNIQSRSRAEHREEESVTKEGEDKAMEEEELMKPFVYNIQPLSYYSTETKEQENIINYINRIKEMRENQIKFEAAKKEEARPAVGKHEDAVVTEAGAEGPIRRQIQHVQIVVGPAAAMAADQGQPQAYGQPFYPVAADGTYRYPYGPPEPIFSGQPQFEYRPAPNAPRRPTVYYVPNIFGPPPMAPAATKGYLDYVNPNYWFNQYFPIVVNNPFDAVHMALSNIVEYGPEADVCRGAAAAGRRADGEPEPRPESRRFGLGGGGVGVKKEDGDWPKVARVKVRRGGVAIAGPGGIATAGSGGTAIVGPGGTAYTTRDGTAVVGPGGRVVHVPRFPIYADGVDADGGEFVPPAGSETVAEGPVIYLDDGAPSDSPSTD